MFGISPHLTRTVSIAIVMLSLLTVTGCNGVPMDEVREELGTVQTQLADARELHAELEEGIAQMEPGEERDRWQARADEIDEWAGTLETTIADVHERLDGAEDELDGVEAVLGTAAPFLPPPWNGVAVAGGGLILGLLRAAKNRSNGRRLAESLEAVKDADGKIDLSDPELQRKVSMLQRSGGKRLVDEAQGRAFSLPV